MRYLGIKNLSDYLNYSYLGVELLYVKIILDFKCKLLLFKREN